GERSRAPAQESGCVDPPFHPLDACAGFSPFMSKHMRCAVLFDYLPNLLGGRPRYPDCYGGNSGPDHVEGSYTSLKPSSFDAALVLPEEVLFAHLAVFKHQLGELQTLHAHRRQYPANAKPGRVALDYKGSDPELSPRLIHCSKNHNKLGTCTVADE